jgi:DNA polymerase-3 subunit delta'
VTVFDQVPGQPEAMAFLARAVRRPAHAYLLAGPEGSGKQLAARAFTAALVCPRGGCAECRDCRLALDDRHPNVALIGPEGRDIRVGDGPEDGGTARWMVTRAYLTAPEPGRKVLRVEQADRMTEEAADVLLKALEDPPADTVFILSSARPHEVPETVRSRCQAISFRPLSEEFVVETLTAEGIEEDRARLASRLAGGNLGRARRVARDDRGLVFRDVALAAYGEAARGSSGALDAAEMLAAEAAEYRKHLASSLKDELGQFADPETGRPLEQYRGMVRRLQDRHQRQERRAERDFLDWSLLALEAWFRDALVVGTGGDPVWAINLDREPPDLSPGQAALAVEAMEEARAALADDTNLNARLVLEEAFLAVAGVAAD